MRAAKSGAVLLFCCMLGILVPAGWAQDDEELRQWASSAEATSEFSPTGWNAEQATGEPDTDDCADSTTAWASAAADGVDDLTVYFDVPVYPTQVNIYQTFNPGSITGIDLITTDGETVEVADTADPGDGDCPGVLIIDITSGAEELMVNGVVIHVDQSDIGNWNEIDAVELVGTPDPDSAPVEENTESSLSGLPVGRSVSCDDGTEFDNGIEVKVVQMRTGSIYTVTAIGMNGFDPVLAVLGDSGRGLCNDDDNAASNYYADLPTSDAVDASGTSAQIIFENRDSSPFSDITFVVGGRNNASGEFVLIVEGMAATSADGAGDVFSVLVSPGMIASGVNINAYMISITEVFDPLIALIDGEYNYMRDDDKNYYSCDDAGNSCWGESTNLGGYYVSRSSNRSLPGGSKDAMLSIPLQEDFVDGFFNFVMRSSGNTYGDYLVAFHMGIGEP